MRYYQIKSRHEFCKFLHNVLTKDISETGLLPYNCFSFKWATIEDNYRHRSPLQEMYYTTRAREHRPTYKKAHIQKLSYGFAINKLISMYDEISKSIPKDSQIYFYY